MRNKVSVIIAVYKCNNYISECAHSLFQQTLNDIEYIFVNDCTPDNSLEVINEYVKKYSIEEKCKIINHNQNQGICQSRNDCLDNATGDYILFIDSDDYIDRDMVELLVKAAIKDNADILKRNKIPCMCAIIHFFNYLF